MKILVLANWFRGKYEEHMDGKSSTYHVDPSLRLIDELKSCKSGLDITSEMMGEGSKF